MIRGLYTAISGMITQEAKQDVVTNNLANANTVGYKEDNLAITRFDDVMLQNYDKVVGGKNVRNEIGTLSLGSKVDSINTDFTQGMIQNTEKPTDFAIEGRGFFAVQRNDGVSNGQYYTRDGHFHVNMNGTLVDDSGDTVLGRNLQTGQLGPINIGAEKFECDASGNISLNGTPMYKLYTADFNNYSSLKKVGDNLYQGDNAAPNNAVVRQNSLEKSNVNVINEMANMITTMRSFETNQKIIQSLDETLNKAVNEVGSAR
ncbi:flagellar basal body rod protein FlgG [Clostridiaceae bacterium UIB06]|uniref:Flagellar basal body rod protein FlgG n=1 Tax=Clostridium thailandense TaxID=2794346 RepID=A0A949TG66_9CLOT|nr:flagellar basal-body rod protein FlgG [Clostridium thailandense]MBV7272199.1 flagellar basal body rod protein FlgG [Clostridium thailandense]MCH5136516.1 flagellar basal body rod protein FlgG [Clostridiaceae bacterium UIB06]